MNDQLGGHVLELQRRHRSVQRLQGFLQGGGQLLAALVDHRAQLVGRPVKTFDQRATGVVQQTLKPLQVIGRRHQVVLQSRRRQQGHLRGWRARFALFIGQHP
ncbi:hypothetical protein [Aquabacterium sp. CECT 9606]|uniref:hypothetical protein n=1 Tax=Aquabacterium sp. CECT 9606 TaxID=2845822 RepID=UPI0035302EFE